jgi:serine/threonine-protein kinase ULK/ATG1
MKLYNYKFDNDYILLITEFCEDGDLTKWINKPDKNADEILDIIIQIIRGIKYLHDNNIVHRDIKPQNILLDNNVIKICDFGFSTIYKSHMDMFNTICGTPLYMCPEVLNLQNYTIKSEIWSLGILLYIIIYNTHPYGILNSIEEYKVKINNIITYEPINLFEKSECNELLISIIKSMLTINYELRPTIDIILHNLEYISDLYNDIKLDINNSFIIDELESSKYVEDDIFQFDHDNTNTNININKNTNSLLSYSVLNKIPIFSPFCKNKIKEEINKKDNLEDEQHAFNYNIEKSFNENHFTKPIDIPDTNNSSNSSFRSNSSSNSSVRSNSLTNPSSLLGSPGTLISNSLGSIKNLYKFISYMSPKK